MSRAPATRDRLLLATRDAVRDVGLPATTAREIAGRASANLAAIPYHFGTKDALVAEALVAEARDLVSPVLDLLASERPPVARATAAARMLGELFDASRPQVPVYLAALAAAPHMPDVRDELRALWVELRSRLAGDIGQQVDDGLLPAWVEPEPMAAAILSLVNGVVVGSAIDPRGPDHRQIAAQFLGLLLDAATPPGAPARPTIGGAGERP